MENNTLQEEFNILQKTIDEERFSNNVMTIHKKIKSIKSEFEKLEWRFWIYSNSVIRRIDRYCHCTGISRFLEYENIQDYSQVFRTDIKFKAIENGNIPKNLNVWICENIEILKTHIDKYVSAREDLLNMISLAIIKLENFDEVKFNNFIGEKIKEMSKCIETLSKNPLNFLTDKLCEIDKTLCEEKYSGSLDIEIYYLEDILYKKSLEIQEKLYEEMVKEFPEIKEIKQDKIKQFEKEEGIFIKKNGTLEDFYRY